MTSPSAMPVADSEQFAAALTRAMTLLHELVERETGLVKLGKLTESQELAPQKTAAANDYVGWVTRAQRSLSQLRPMMPATVLALQEQHARLREALQMNLTVLATAHAVSEAVVRGVNAEVQKRAMPQTYTAAGLRNAPRPGNVVVPIAVSRTL
jgi:hypothetical protein